MIREKTNPLIFVLTIFAVFLSLIVYNKYVWFLDALVLYFWYEYLWLKKSIKKVSVDVKADARCFTNEPFTVKFTIKNDSEKFLNVKINFPSSLKKPEQVLFLEPKSKLTYEVTSSFGTRGLKSAEPFVLKFFSKSGLFEFYLVHKIDSNILVLPKPEMVIFEKERFVELTPNKKSNFKLLEDISYIRELREYNSEPLNRIHWKASAKFNKLMVKEYEYTSSAKVFVLLDLNLSGAIYSKKAWESIRKKYEEDAISAVAGLVNYLSTKHIHIQLSISDKTGVNTYKFKEPSLYYEPLALSQGTIENQNLTSDFFGSIKDSITPTDTVVLMGMYLTVEEVEELIRLKSLSGKVIVMLMPYGYRKNVTGKFKSYFDLPLEVRKTYEYAKLLAQEHISVQIWYENTALQEGIEAIW